MTWRGRFPWWRRLLCAVGLHSWQHQTCEPTCEIQGCRCCPAMRARAIANWGAPLEPWEAYEPEPLLPEW